MAEERSETHKTLDVARCNSRVVCGSVCCSESSATLSRRRNNNSSESPPTKLNGDDDEDLSFSLVCLVIPKLFFGGIEKVTNIHTSNFNRCFARIPDPLIRLLIRWKRTIFSKLLSPQSWKWECEKMATIDEEEREEKGKIKSLIAKWIERKHNPSPRLEP